MNGPPLPAGVTIAPPPPELKLGQEDDSWRRWRLPDPYADHENNRHDPLAEATAFPNKSETDTPDALRAKLFACSGGIDSTRYQEASRFRAMPDMTWPEARVALNRLLLPVASYDWRGRATSSDYVTLAEFTLTAHGFTGFAGLRGEHAVKLRNELHHVIRVHLYERLHGTLHRAGVDSATIARPITKRLHAESWRGNRALWGLVPIAPNRWVRINDAIPDEAVTALDYLRFVLGSWNARRPEAEQVADRMVKATNMPTAAEYAVALHIADMLAFTSAKLDMLYAGIMHSMPVHRLYPATSEREAVELWWPWGRPPPLVDGGPARPSKARKKVLDPRIITATRPQDVVREVMQKTGINRSTAQHLTAPTRIGMRLARQRKAEALLRQGVTKAEVARSVGLSPSRISAMFKGQTFPINKALDGIDIDLSDSSDEDDLE